MLKNRSSYISNLIGFFLIILISNVIEAQNLVKEVSFVDRKYIPCYNTKKLGNTTIFQGNKKKKEYFEGWYFKMVSIDGSSILSVIPGISLSADGNEQHAFIQIINGNTAETSYYSFPIEEFSFSKKEFAIKISKNYFSNDSILLNISQKEDTVTGIVKMHNTVKYKSGRLFNPGIMGWYRFVPFMECYHGVVSLTHTLSGNIFINNESHSFNNGRGYIEKDYGSSMPSEWIWMQSNNFTDTSSSLMLSIANIPWLGKSFTGFLGFFYHKNEIYHFATYRSTKLNLKIIDNDELLINIKNRKETIILNVISNNTGLLMAPVEGSMDRRIPESIDATIKITMLNKEGETIYQDSTNIAGLEMVGEFHKLEGLLK
jgi:tocopherol cyclase